MEQLDELIAANLPNQQTDKVILPTIRKTIETIEKNNLTIINKRTDNTISIPLQSDARERFLQLLVELFMHDDMKHLYVI